MECVHNMASYVIAQGPILTPYILQQVGVCIIIKNEI